MGVRGAHSVLTSVLENRHFYYPIKIIKININKHLHTICIMPYFDLSIKRNMKTAKEDCKECTPDQPCKKHWQRKHGESESDYDNRKVLYELTGIRDESMHIHPYADMIDKLTYVQKADFAKHALDLERDLATYKALFEYKCRELNGWIAEYRAARQEVERLKDRYESALLDDTELRKGVEARDRTIERLENDLSEAVEIMEAIYANVDQYHLDFAFHGGECYEKLKNYIGA